MMIEYGIFARLTKESTVSGLISNRAYPQNLPQNPTYPAIRYNKISSVPTLAHDGAGDLMTDRFQFDCVAPTYQEAKQVALVLRRDLHGDRSSWGAVEVEGCFFQNENDNFGKEVETSTISVDFLIMYKDSGG